MPNLTTTTTTMLIDDILPEFDATITEHAVVEASPDVVYQAARDLDFLQVHSPVLDGAMFVRGLPAKVASLVSDRPSPPTPPTMRLGDLLDGQNVLPGWTGLGEIPGREVVFGAVGKVWQADIDWRPVSADDFRAFDEPDYAKIAAGFSMRHYGEHRTLLSYEARTAGTDPDASRKFLRYWWLVNRFVTHVMRAAVMTIKKDAESAVTAMDGESASAVRR